MNKKIIIIPIVIALFLLAICWPHKKVIKIGFFAGSNWDVPNGDCYKIIDQAIESFEKENPLIKVEYKSGILKGDYSEWLSSQYLKGEEPDVFMILSEDFNTLSSLGALKNLDTFIEDDQDFNSNDYYKTALNMGNYQNKQYALPYESNPTLMFMNKTLLKKENIDIPTNDWTLDDFYNICKQVSKDTNNDGLIDQYGCYNFNWLDSIYSHGVDLFDDEGNECYLNQGAVKKSVLFIQKLNDLNQGYMTTSKDFDKGIVAFSPMQFSQYRTYKPYPWRVKKYSQFEWDCVKMPTLPNQGSSEVSSLLMGISSRTSYPQDAWRFLKKLTYDQQSQQNLFKYSQGVSSLKSITQSSETMNLLKEELDVDLSLLNDVMENTVSHSKFRKYESTLQILNTEIQQMLQNDEDLDLTLMSLQKEINKYLKD